MRARGRSPFLRRALVLLLSPSVLPSHGPAQTAPSIEIITPADRPATAARPPPPLPADSRPRELAPFVVQGERYIDPFYPMPRLGFRIELPFEPPSFSYELSPMIVTAARVPQAVQNVAPTARVILAEELRSAPTLTIDGTLRSVPGFSLFRRSDSFTANPTAQGVSLRGLGPSGASRSLVLLDGVPLNDPFGGWIAWTKIPRDGLARAEVIPGGGATAWGNATLGGTIQLFTRRARGERMVVRQPPPPGSAPTVEGNLVWGTRATLHTRAEIGDYGTRSLEFSAVYPEQHGTLQLLSRVFATDGFALVAPERRGPIDIAAWSRHRWLTARWQQPLGANVSLTATVRGFEEQRGNGTPYQKNGSREKFASLATAGQSGLKFTWDSVVYAQDQSFASTFSGVNAARTAETPASDQFAVPALAWGAAWNGAWRHTGISDALSPRTSLGADVRLVRGETRENFTFVAGNFTRQRVAGGRQLVGGIYGAHDRSLSETWRATVGARVDAWRDTDGHRRETDRATGVVLRNDRYPDLADVEFSPSAGLVWRPSKTWRTRASVQHAFRRPTLNELYRPFRVGANVTEANAALHTESVDSAEVGTEWTTLRQPPAPPTPPGRPSARQPNPVHALTLGVTAFANELHDAVGNVTIARGPGTFPLVGTIAAGGVGRQRLNLDRTRVRGVELSAKWTPASALTLSGDALFNDATVRRAPIAPALVGNRVAQVPRRSASLGAVWRAPWGFTLTPRLRYIGRQFEDDENQLTLGAAVIGDLGIARPISRHLELYVSGENLGNARIETGRSADGIVNVGTPRLVVGGLRGTW